MASIPVTIPTQSQILTTYFEQLQAQNPNINPTIDSTLNILGNTYSGMLAGLYATIYLYGLNIFPQTASGQFLDIQLAEWGLPPRSAGLYALGTVRLTATQSSIVSFPSGAILTDSTGTLQYTVMVNTFIPIGQLGSIPIMSITANDGYAQPIGRLLKIQNPPIPNVTQVEVVSLNDGGNVETDTEIQTRLLNSIQNYLLGGTLSDYQNWCLQASTLVSGSTVLSPSQGNVAIYLLGGQLNINNILSHPDVSYNRVVNDPVIETVSNYIEGKRPFTDVVDVFSCITNLISSPVIINVQLSGQFVLANMVPNTGLVNQTTTISIQDFIKQEFRRAVILSSQNAQYLAGESNYYITAETLISQLSNSLSASSIIPGVYAQLLLNVNLTLADSHGLLVPNPNTGLIIYDVSLNYSNLTVSLIT